MPSTSYLFWPNEVLNDNGGCGVTRDAKEAPTNSNTTYDRNDNIEGSIVVDLIMATMPNVKKRGYFGPSKDKPLPEPS